MEKIAKEKIKEEERQKKGAAKEEQRQAREQVKEEERQARQHVKKEQAESPTLPVADMQELWVNKSKLSEKTLQQGAAKGRKRKADAAEVQEEEPPEKVAVRGFQYKPEPFFSVERSRNQVMARTGFRGTGESVKFRYGGNGGDFADADAATYAAQCWVNEQRKIQGLD